jgi:hypothetical protein
MPFRPYNPYGNTGNTGNPGNPAMQMLQQAGNQFSSTNDDQVINALFQRAYGTTTPWAAQGPLTTPQLPSIPYTLQNAFGGQGQQPAASPPAGNVPLTSDPLTQGQAASAGNAAGLGVTTPQPGISDSGASSPFTGTAAPPNYAMLGNLPGANMLTAMPNQSQFIPAGMMNNTPPDQMQAGNMSQLTDASSFG